MRRSDELAPLSRDHHLALGVALRLRRATAEDLGEAIERFDAYWTAHGERHFMIEERLVLPVLPETDVEWANATRRVSEEHAEMRARAAVLPHERSVEAARRLGEVLNDHVRYEERVLFELLERRLPADALARLGRAIASAEAAG